MRITYRIHPAIGVARVGDSTDDFFIGPESPGAPALLAGLGKAGATNGHYKDSQQRIKRQGARFRIFEYATDDAGATAVREISAKDADIEWEVHLVNRKAAAPAFDADGRRNVGLAEADLVVDAGAQKISGINQAMKRLQGRFLDLEVPLGDLLTDDAGRLIVLGGFGHSTSVPADRTLVNFVNNDGWCDDVSDGPVRATIRLKGAAQTAPADSSWLIVAPPDFAPSIENVVTLYDVVYAMTAKFVDLSLRVTDATSVSFTKDVYPILRRVSRMRWVSEIAAEGHGEGGRGDFLATVKSLADNKSGQSRRNTIFGRLRSPTGDGGNMPKLPEDVSPDVVGQSLTEVQYARMKRWAEGTFEADWTGSEPVAVPFDHLREVEKPTALDRAALEACVGGPFFPGIEIGRIALEESMYDKTRPFRVNPSVEPGGLTARMAVPWQADFHDCGFERGSDWWPGQRPTQVTRGDRRVEWMPRDWTRDQLVDNWSRLGFVVEEEANGKVAYVERERRFGKLAT